MNLTIRFLGAELLHISTEPQADEGPGDALTTAFGFTHTTPLLTDGRYGCDDNREGR